MSELNVIKMSDHFAGELSLIGDCIEDSNFHYATTSCASDFDGVDYGEAICHAVNNHDRLVEELEQLTKERDTLIAIVENLVPNYDVEELSHYAGIDQDSASRIIDILNNQ